MFTKIKNFFFGATKTTDEIVQELADQHYQMLLSKGEYKLKTDHKVLLLTSAELSHLKLALKSYLSGTQKTTQMYKTYAKDWKQFMTYYEKFGTKLDKDNTYTAQAKECYKKAAMYYRANIRISEIQRKIKQAA